jgi:hypothetical protein
MLIFVLAARQMSKIVLISLTMIGIAGGALVRFTKASLPKPPPSAPLTAVQGTLVKREGIWELTLRGDPRTLGADHARLTRELMQTVDRDLDHVFREKVGNRAARFVIENLVRMRARRLPEQIPQDRLIELAAEAQAYGPADPLSDFMPTFPRFLVYHALYDIALSFEHSPLLGCTVFGVSGGAAKDGHVLVGRNFDLEQDTFDRDKVVERVAETGKIAYVHVAWAGMTGVVTGLSRAGIFVSVNGGRAGEPREDGVPLPFLLRDILSRAHTLDEAIAIAKASPVMVSHILFVADGASGEMAVIERSPAMFAVRRAPRGALYATNHFLTPELAADPHNKEVEQHTTTLDRYARLHELLPPASGAALDVAGACAVLRDRRGRGGAELAPGDRHAIDAGIATHSVVADVTAHVLYVAAGPHTGGKYVAFSP